MSKFAYMVRVEGASYANTWRTEWADGCPMPDTYFKGRPVYFGDLHLDGVDSYFESASYADTDEDLDDDELNELTEREGDYIVTENCEHFGFFPQVEYMRKMAGAILTLRTCARASILVASWLKE